MLWQGEHAEAFGTFLRRKRLVTGKELSVRKSAIQALVGLAAFVPLANAQPADSPLDPALRKAVVETFAGKLESDYAIAETGQAMANAVRVKLGVGAYNGLSSGDDLAFALEKDARAVSHDLHLRVGYMQSREVRSAMTMAPSPELIRKQNGHISKLEILDGNVGYLRIDGFTAPEFAREPMTAAFAFLKSTDALIIDARYNSGGDPNSVALLMSFLSEGKPYLVNTFHHREGGRIEEFWTTDLGGASYGARKPLFVLTSKDTFSGGEEFAYDVKAFKRGLVVGETTGGGANPTRLADLDHGFFALIPFARAVNPVTQTDWEGRGVSPDHATPAEQSLARAHRLALEELKTHAQDLHERARLEGFALGLELANADLAGRRIANTQLKGVYAPAFPAPSFTVEERDGKLLLRLSGAPDAVLVPVMGNRYRLDGFPDGFFVTFLDRNGRLSFLQEQLGSALIFTKQ